MLYFDQIFKTWAQPAVTVTFRCDFKKPSDCEAWAVLSVERSLERGPASSIAQPLASDVPSMAELEPVAGDVAGAGEEDFEEGMAANAADRDAADADNDGKLDFTEFCPRLGVVCVRVLAWSLGGPR